MNIHLNCHYLLSRMAAYYKTDLKTLMDNLDELLPPAVDDLEIEHLRNGETGKRLAVQSYYNRLGCSLMEAEKAIDIYLESPEYDSKKPTQEEIAIAVYNSKVDAVKMYKNRCQVSLKDALNTITKAMEEFRKNEASELLKKWTLNDEEINFLNNGRKLRAVASLKNRSGLSLMQAKTIVESR